MNADASPFADDADAEFGPVIEQYENALHEGWDDTPEQWLLDQFPDNLRKQLADLHWLYRVSQPVDEILSEMGSTSSISNPTIPGYEILGKLGFGGMGIVYKARQIQLNRVVALKVLLDGDHATEEKLARFRSEALAAARLKHENIVTIHEVGEHDGRPYLVLEYVESGSLKQHLDGTPQPARSSAQLVETIARAVHHAHEHNIVHRDLKPANILLVRRDGPAAIALGNGNEKERFEPKVADFGLAKHLDNSANPTLTGAIVGTPSYMAPEQASGRTQEVGPAVDVYALGAILYELLSGRAPFKAETMLETIQQVQNDDPLPLRSQVRKVPRELEIICLKCLQKSPDKRYKNALALAEDLRRFADGQPILARPTGPWERGVKWVKRNRLASLLIGAGITILVMLSTLLIEVVWSNRALKEAANRERVLADEAKEQKELAEQERERAVQKQTLATTYLQNALDLLEPLSMEIKGDFLAKTPDGQYFREQCSSRARAFYQKLMSEQGNPDREVQRQIGRAFNGLGMSHSVLNETQPAEEAFLRAVAIQEKLVDEFPAEVTYRVDLAVTYQNAGDEYLACGDKEKAAMYYGRIITLFEALPRGSDRIKLFGLKLANRLFNMGKWTETEVWLGRIIDNLESSLKDESKPEERQKFATTLALTLNLRAVVLMQVGKAIEAEQSFECAEHVKEAKLSPEMAELYRKQREQNTGALKKMKQNQLPDK
jgi:serine/threonine protein kinase